MTDGATTVLMRKAYARWAPIYDLVYVPVNEASGSHIRRICECIGNRNDSAIEVMMVVNHDAIRVLYRPIISNIVRGINSSL